MISTGFEQRVKTQQIINNQLPEFILDESPKISEFLKQYYISQEYQSGPSDIAENLDQYLKFDNLTPEVISGETVLSSNINSTDKTITVQSTKSFPLEYGLLKIDDEIVTYSKIEGNKFVGCVRGFSAISSYKNSLNPEELVFSETLAASHSSGSKVINLSTLFLREFYKKLKYLFAPGFEDVNLQSDLNVNTFLKQIRDFYNSKGTDESFKILFKVLYGFNPKILNLEEFLIKPSESEYIKRRVLIGQLITSGANPNNLIGEEIKSSDNDAFGPVSEIEIVTRNNKVFYKIYLFSGYDDNSTIFGKFKITPKTKISETVSIGSSIITVDSTSGFKDSGSIKYNNKTISYTDKSINQFFNCSGISEQLNQGTDVYSTPTIYGYENGDETKKVEFIVISSLNGVEDIGKINYFSDKDRVSFGNFGESIPPSLNNTFKEINFNSWIYNVRSRYEVKDYSIGNSTFTLFENPDKSSLKVNDYVDIVKQNSFATVVENTLIKSINQNVIEIDKQITNVLPGQNISVIRRYDYASSLSIPLKYSKVLSNVQNTYNDNNEYVYVASNSLPSFKVNKNIHFSKKTISTSSDNDSFFSNLNLQTQKYSVLSFDNNVPFNTGDIVTYTHTTPSPINGLESNKEYVIEVLNEKNKIRLYISRSFVAKNDYIEFSKDFQLGEHLFTLSSHYGRSLAPKKSFIKIPLSPKDNYENILETEPGVIGSLINGVDIINYKSYDRIYYGPLESIRVINSGDDYDVLYPPPVTVSDPVGLGTTALVNLVVSGSLKKVIVDPNDVAIERVVSVSISGGNGRGALLEPIISNKYREIEFNASDSSFGGGVDVSYDTITFLSAHEIKVGDKIIYNKNGNLPIGIGDFGGSNTDQGKYLSNGAIYYPEIVNSKTIRLYNNVSDLNSGINTVGLTTINNGGIHKFRIYDSKKVLSEIRVVDGGIGYQNRVLRVKTSGISTITNFITFKNHGFKNGDLINYSSTGTPVSGISTLKNYYIINSEKDRFQLSDADFISVGASKTNYERGKVVSINDVGSGHQIFSYPEIKVNINVEYSGFIGTITASPILRGKIVDAYLYENGTNYGSEVLNFHKKPKLSIKRGYGGQLKPVIVNGRVLAVQVQNKGSFYSPGIELTISGDGIGCILRPIVIDGRIESVVVVNGGIGYNKSNTSITIETPGKNAFLDSSVRYLSVNNYFRFSDEILLESGDSDLNYGIVGYSTDREGLSFSDSSSSHSKIIGWAIDGNPIYGPYAYKNPADFNSSVVFLDTSYSLNPNNIYNRPLESSFSAGFFVEDYVYNNSGDLDENNGRFARTPEFPNGTYAYYVGVSTDLSTGKLIPKFPYFIGKNYRSKVYDNFIIDQSFDLNSTSLIRNTFPYRVKSQYSSNDFLPKYNNRLKQTSIIETILPGKVESLNIVNSGSEYSIGDSLIFDNTGTNGGGISAEVSEIHGKNVFDLNTSLEIYENSTFEWKNTNTIKINVLPYHNLLNGDTIEINGISTSIKNLYGTHQIKFENIISVVEKNIPSSSGIVTDINLTYIPKNVSIGSSIKINQETFSVLNKFDDINVLRVKRSNVGVSHTSGNLVSFLPSSFEINISSDYFESKNNDVVYFNPHNSVGVGTLTGSSISLNYILGNTFKSISVPTQSIYIPNHPFKTNQRLLFSRPSTSSGIVVSNESGGSSFTLLNSNSEYVYAINKSKDYIGIVTQVGLTTTDGLYFTNNGSFSFEYSLTNEVDKVTGNIEKIKTIISTDVNHDLSNGDFIKLNVVPSSSVGIKTNTSVKLIYNSNSNILLVDPIGFSSSHVNTTKDEITLNSHGLYTGQKIFYNYTNEPISGLSTGIYYAYKVNNNTIKISETYLDSITFPPKTVSIGSTGGSSQTISQVNPSIESIKNNNLIFNLSDPSLQGFDFNIYYDKNLKTNFVSIGNSSSFNVQKFNIIGISTDANCQLIYNTSFPNRLYYSLSKLGKSIFENQNENDFKIEFVDSLYNGEYKVSGIGTTTFSISLKKTPEKLNYLNNSESSITYTTKSKTSKGPISNILIINSGSGYKKLPSVVGISSLSTGKDAVIECQSKTIGKPGIVKILNDGFEYSSDNTIRPSCDIDSFALITESQTITEIDVINGGKNYISAPNLKLVNTIKGKEINSGFIKPVMSDNSISEIKVINPPNGLDSVTHKLFTVKNSNGIPIVGITTYSYLDGTVECTLRTPPVIGFKNSPFSVGDLIFVEGIQKESFTDELGNVTSPGTGFNSADNGYNFFEVTEFINTDPAILKFNIGKYTKFAGIPVPIQTVFSSIVNFKNYPIFKIKQEYSKFFDNETISVNNILTDVQIRNSSDTSVKLTNTSYDIKKNDIVRGSVSGSIAKISQLFTYNGRYSVDSSNENRFGWKNDVGKLNLDTQVIPDNDYYQNLSYSIQSPIEYDKFVGPVNSIVHPIGLKNFADTGITSSAKTSIGSSEKILTTLDFVEEKRVDTINIFDFAADYDTTIDSSQYIRLRNKKLSDYIQCNTNRVLQIDDISNIFSSAEFNKDTFLETVEYPITDLYSKFLIQVCTEDKLKFQISEVVVLNDLKGNTYTLNKSDLFTDESLGTFSGETGPVGDPVLKFSPTDPYNSSYQLKTYRETFDDGFSNIGVGFTDYGFIRLSAKTEKLSSTVGVSTVVFRGLSSQFNLIYSNSLIVNTDDYKSNYYEVIGYYDGVNTHLSEFYFDTENLLGGISKGYIGTFGLNVNNEILNLSFTNNTNKNVVVKTKTVGFGTTSSGIGTYRFIVDGQIEGTERTTRLESSYKNITGITTIKSFDGSLESSLKSIIKVSVGSTTAVHQVLVTTNQVVCNIQSYPFLSIGSTSGIGTFSATMDQYNVNIEFHPDPQFSSKLISIQSFDQYFYSEFDEYNSPENLTYGTSIESIGVNRYGSINNFGKDRLNFELNYNRIPIFQKLFNPKNTSIFDKDTGTITIKNHFFEDGEELIYSPGSSLIGVAATSVGIGTTIVGGASIIADVISGFSTITGITTTFGITAGELIIGPNISSGTQVVSIGQTYSYFIGNVVSSGSTVITGIANTEIISVGSGIFSGNNNSLGSVISVGINSITLSSPVQIASNRLYYSNAIKPALTISNVSTGTTFRSVFSTGISTNICPSKVYAIKIDNNKFKITGVSGGSGIAFTFTSTGSGNIHKFEMKKKNEKSLITVNGVTQYPLSYTPLTYTLSGNYNGSVGIGTSFIALSGISSITPKDILKIEDEYLTVSNVGFGTTVFGPITGIGSIPIVEVVRASLGSSETSHSDGTSIRIYRGAYNIIGNQIWFAEAPDGKGKNDRLGDNYLPLPKSTFNGRVFLRRDYSGNQIYDDISDSFTGIARTFTLYKEGNTVSNVISGNNLVFINDIFQTPDTQNNTGNNYNIVSSSGISSVSFTGITIPNTSTVFTVESDVNQNQVPRGGLVVSLASTGGIGYAPLVGIPTGMIEVQIGVGGSISNIGFTTSLVIGKYTTGTIGINSNIITGINTSGLNINQRLTDIPGIYLPSIVSRDIILPDKTKILQFNTRITSIGIGTIYISKLSTNSSSVSTSFGFDFGPIFGSGYNKNVSIAVTEKSHTGTSAVINALVGVGGSIRGFTIVSGGSGYSNPIVSIPDPSYGYLPIKPISRPGVGNTDKCGIGLSLSIDIGPTTTSVGIGSTLFGLTGFEVIKPGYGFLIGDTFTVAGLVTDFRLSNPVEEVKFTVTDIRTDSFASWQLGEFDYIDSVKLLQDGVRKRFPLFKNDQLLSFEKDENDPISSLIDFDSVLLIYVNGVMQEPKVSYTFNGGTTFIFNEPPRPEDNIAIFFYRGTLGVDSFEIAVNESIKPGDTVQINKDDYLPNSIGQESRVVSFIVSSDVMETGIYLEDGIDENLFRPMSWTKQKTDLIINDSVESKQRDSLESLVFPTAKIIKGFSSDSDEIFVDNSQFFKYEENQSNEIVQRFSGLITLNENPIFAKLSANVSASGTISSINIHDSGSGYVGIGTSLRVKTRSIVGNGGTDAIIDVTIASSGIVTNPVYIINPGSGYNSSNPPEIIAPIPNPTVELIQNIQFVQGFSGIITGITTNVGVGTDLAIKFFIKYNPTDSNDDLIAGYPIFIFDTTVGNGITSIDANNNQIVGIGTTFLDNIYYVHSIQRSNLNGVMLCNILSSTNTVGLSTSSNICGKFSWGRLSGFKRSTSPISIDLKEYTTASGLGTFPTIQRRKYGLRDSGALKKGLEI